MRGNADDEFFDNINEIFICLVGAAIRHCLKGWQTGEYVEQGRGSDFKYDTAASKYTLRQYTLRQMADITGILRNIRYLPSLTHHLEHSPAHTAKSLVSCNKG